jgi:hypothetical protein
VGATRLRLAESDCRPAHVSKEFSHDQQGRTLNNFKIEFIRWLRLVVQPKSLGCGIL